MIGIMKLIVLCLIGSWALLPFTLHNINRTLEEIKDEIKKGV